ncbi:MAG TPA: putative toxin-antitoxin system toxin component, PIN family [Pyrinomonadaceae bacterium]|nr:putative toxin-antitoxin system toxin component, PIN family [Pyrinomonadaceae bacterium]
MPSEIIYAVFDTNIFLQSLLNPHSIAAKCFETVRNGKIKLFVSKDTLAEVRDVVLRPNILARLPDAEPTQIEAFIEDISNISTLIQSVPEIFKFERDPKDEIIINLAVASEAEYIVSRDKDLLDLMSGFTDDCKEFRQRFRPLKVVEPLEFLQIVEEN